MSRNFQRRAWWQSPSNIALLVFLFSIAFFLVSEHWAHLIPVLPWLILLACPAMHLFMHGGHGGHGEHEGHSSSKENNSDSEER